MNVPYYVVKLVIGSALPAFHVHGSKQLPSGPRLTISNHRSELDIAWHLDATWNYKRFIAKEELNRGFMGFVYRLGETIFVKRNQELSIEEASELERAIDEGSELVLFSEGTRNKRVIGRPGTKTGVIVDHVVRYTSGELPIVPAGIGSNHLAYGQALNFTPGEPSYERIKNELMPQISQLAGMPYDPQHIGRGIYHAARLAARNNAQ